MASIDYNPVPDGAIGTGEAQVFSGQKIADNIANQAAGAARLEMWRQQQAQRQAEKEQALALRYSNVNLKPVKYYAGRNLREQQEFNDRNQALMLQGGQVAMQEVVANARARQANQANYEAYDKLIDETAKQVQGGKYVNKLKAGQTLAQMLHRDMKTGDYVDDLDPEHVQHLLDSYKNSPELYFDNGGYNQAFLKNSVMSADGMKTEDGFNFDRQLISPLIARNADGSPKLNRDLQPYLDIKSPYLFQRYIQDPSAKAWVLSEAKARQISPEEVVQQELAANAWSKDNTTKTADPFAKQAQAAGLRASAKANGGTLE